MKKSAVIVFALCVFLTACSAAEKDNSAAENTAETATAAKTEASFSEPVETTTITMVSEPAITIAEAIKISMEDISDYVYDGETQTVGNDTYGYLDIPIEWKYEEPDAHKRAVMAYIDDEGNRIDMKNCDLIGYGISIKDINKLAEAYSGKGVFNDTETIKYEIDGYTAYKTTYSRVEAIELVNYRDENCAHWIFECEDGVNRSVGFSGSEDFIRMSDNIIKTYHLHN